MKKNYYSVSKNVIDQQSVNFIVVEMIQNAIHFNKESELLYLDVDCSGINDRSLSSLFKQYQRILMEQEAICQPIIKVEIDFVPSFIVPNHLEKDDSMILKKVVTVKRWPKIMKELGISLFDVKDPERKWSNLDVLEITFTEDEYKERFKDIDRYCLYNIHCFYLKNRNEDEEIKFQNRLEIIKKEHEDIAKELNLPMNSKLVCLEWCKRDGHKGYDDELSVAFMYPIYWGLDHLVVPDKNDYSYHILYKKKENETKDIS